MNAVPVLGGSSDVGFGGGVLGAITRHERGYSPYRFKLAVGGITTYRFHKVDGKSRLPYQDFYAELQLPDLGGHVLRLQARASYTREAPVHYYGVGDASVRLPRSDVSPQLYDFTRIHPTLWAKARLALGRAFFLRVGNSYTEDFLELQPGSKLERDIHSPDPEVRDLVGDPPSRHAVDFFEYALLYDTRDDETVTRRGMYHKLQLRLSPGGTRHFPYRYGQANVTLRFYATPVRRVTIAARLVGDFLFGDPPFYELARFDDTTALGGSKGVRGVPAARYAGKIKVFGNLESRVDLFGFHLLDKHFRFGLATFVDAGRVWADYASHPELDGTSLGLKYGLGGGVRLQQGQTFVVRLDVAWSPDARPLGGYFTAGEIF